MCGSMRAPKIVKAKVRGASHIRSGAPCQDAMLVHQSGGATILSVADGHGSESCPYSDIGSQVAVEVFRDVMETYRLNYQHDPSRLMKFLKEEGTLTFAKEIDREWKSRILAKANSQSSEPAIWKLYGTTLLGLYLTPDFYFAFQIGDGDLLYMNADSVETVLEVEELLGTETYSLSQSKAWQKANAKVGRLTPNSQPQSFLLATDGFSNSYGSKGAFQQTAKGYFDAVEDYGTEAVSNELVGWLNETSEGGSGDDITLMMAVYNIEEPALPALVKVGLFGKFKQLFRFKKANPE